MERKFEPASLLAVVIMLFAGASLALCSQATGTGGTIQGVVTDPSGAVVPGAQVVLSNGATGYNQTEKTGVDGAFRLSNIPPNNYRLDITSPGLQSSQQTIDIRTSVPQELKIALALANSSETVDVSASAETIENVASSHTDVSQTLDRGSSDGLHGARSQRCHYAHVGRGRGGLEWVFPSAGRSRRNHLRSRRPVHQRSAEQNLFHAATLERVSIDGTCQQFAERRIWRQDGIDRERSDSIGSRATSNRQLGSFLRLIRYLRRGCHVCGGRLKLG